ncbi:MAG TPA: hypothetical protein VF175_11335, partial [Lacipirellula sp.]
MHRRNLKTVKAAMAVAAIALAVAAPASAALVNLTPQGGAVNSNTGVNLNDLLTGAEMGIIVGDKIFTGFSYSALGDMPEATDVQVLGFRDPDGNW